MPSDSHASAVCSGSRFAWLDHGYDWLAANRQRALLAGVAFQFIVLLVMISLPLTTLLTGDTILLRVAPVDPRDLFRGDYVILSYEISRPWTPGGAASPADWQHGRNLEGRTIYVTLKPAEDGKHWRESGYQFDPPREGSFIRGTVQANGLVEYGIESYFVQEGQGLDYERAVGSGNLSAEVAIDRQGQARLKRLVIE